MSDKYSHADPNKKYIQQTSPKEPDAEPARPSQVPSPTEGDLEIDTMLDKHMMMLYRQTYILHKESQWKFSKEDSQTMRDNLKLLLELQDRERKHLLTLSAEELAKLDENIEKSRSES